MTITLLTGDARDVLPTLPADSVHTVITSPPYYGLRDYGTAQWEGGDAACGHKADIGARASSGLNGSLAHKDGRIFTPYRDTCGKCGARRIDRQIGLEATPEAYLATMVQVFREIKRVLRPDGTCWVNIGDSYAGNANSGGDSAPRQRLSPGGGLNSGDAVRMDGMVTKPGKPKDLLMMPARLALALQADGWWVRSDIIWHKPNPMPESCTDRPTSAHEHVFLLTRSSRYFYDADAVREEATDARGMLRFTDRRSLGAGIVASGNERPEQDAERGTARNLRNVWTIATHAFPEAHFATYPPELVERCIKAGTSERGCCAACGKPWVRTTQASFIPTQDPANLKGGSKGIPLGGWDFPRGRNDTTTIGWSPGCKCDAGIVPATVLDPFLGSGTTALVADRLQRHAIGIDLSLTYAEMAQRRIEMDCPLFTSWAPAEPPEDERMADLFAEAAE